MVELSDAFVTLPGGFGTLDEFFEVITLKQLRVHNKACAIVNTNGIYDPLLSFLQDLCDKGFARPDHTKLYDVVPTPQAALNYIQAYVPTTLSEKKG